MKNKREKERAADPAAEANAAGAPPTETAQAPENGTAQSPASAQAPGTSEDRAEAAEERTGALQAEVESLKNQLLRRAAEFENYKRRSEENNLALVKRANESLIIELLSVLDDFDRSLKAGAEHGDTVSFQEGVELIRGKLVRVLEGRGLKRFESAGASFDVGYHDALLQIPRADLPDHTIIEEIEPGYQLYDKVIRHAKVIVSSKPVEGAGPGGTADHALPDGA